MRIFSVSDLHTNFTENRRRLQQVSSTSYLRDVLVVAGDVADDLRIIDWTMRKLRSQFGQVFYVPGHLELWVRDYESDYDRQKEADISELEVWADFFLQMAGRDGAVSEFFLNLNEASIKNYDGP